METRMTAVEDQISAMEVNLKKGFDESLASFFEKFQVAQAQAQPPGGGLAGGVTLISCHETTGGERQLRSNTGGEGQTGV